MRRYVLVTIDDIYRLVEEASGYIYCRKCRKKLSEAGYEVRLEKSGCGSMVAVGKKIMRVIAHIYCGCGAYYGTHYDAFSAMVGAKRLMARRKLERLHEKRK